MDYLLNKLALCHYDNSILGLFRDLAQNVRLESHADEHFNRYVSQGVIPWYVSEALEQWRDRIEGLEVPIDKRWCLYG